MAMTNMRGQCYDGVSSCPNQMQIPIPNVFQGHALHLACNDTVKNYKIIRDALEIFHEVIKLMKLPWPDVVQHKLKEQMLEKTSRHLCVKDA